MVRDLLGFVEKKRNELLSASASCTGDTEYWTQHDFDFTRSYLLSFDQFHSRFLEEKIKPKGTVLIISSFNEPLVLSVIPILSALLAGNRVFFKPSRRAKEVCDLLWGSSGVTNKHSLPLHILCDYPEVKEHLVVTDAVYFFGSQENARELAKECVEKYIEFHPETEAADCKIVKKAADPEWMKTDALQTLEESYTHMGQTCQRIQGVYVQKDVFGQYLAALEEGHKELSSSGLHRHISSEHVFNKVYLEGILDEIKSSDPKRILRNTQRSDGFPLLVVSPREDSDLVKNAYFCPVMWICSFDNDDHLIRILNKRKFFLGINIYSDQEDFVEKVVKNTRFSRYTVNSTHTNIRPFEGWGGNWPSGLGGYDEWIRRFSNSYSKIEEN